MSRSGYTDDADDQWALICWRGAVRSAIRGRRGQALLREMRDALDSLPEQRLVAGTLEREDDGAVCALGAVGKCRGIDMKELDPNDSETVAATFGVAPALAREIVYENDDGGLWGETDQQRFARMRRWVESQIKTPGDAP